MPFPARQGLNINRKENIGLHKRKEKKRNKKEKIRKISEFQPLFYCPEPGSH
jgi:hypothetical protein